MKFLLDIFEKKLCPKSNKYIKQKKTNITYYKISKCISICVMSLCQKILKIWLSLGPKVPMYRLEAHMEKLLRILGEPTLKALLVLGCLVERSIKGSKNQVYI